MRGIDAALHCLQIIALLCALGDEAIGMRDLGPFECRQRRLALARTHMDPDDIAQFHARIRGELDLAAEAACLRLGGNLDALARYVVFPAVIGAAQPVLFVAAEPERHATMRTELVDDADAPPAVAEGEQALREKLDAHRRTIRVRHFRRQQGWNPIAAKQIADRRAGAASREELVNLARRHRGSLHCEEADTARASPLLLWQTSRPPRLRRRCPSFRSVRA